MSAARLFDRYLAPYPNIWTMLYFAIVAAFFLIAVFALAAITERYREFMGSSEILARLEARAPNSSAGSIADTGPTGSPFLEGQTITIASAALLQRMTSAITRAKGNLVSSEVEPQSLQSKDGYVKVIASCELEQKALQQLLYDIEAGKPFLFVDQLEVQGPASEGGRMRVLLAVSGLWRARQ